MGVGEEISFVVITLRNYKETLINPQITVINSVFNNWLFILMKIKPLYLKFNLTGSSNKKILFFEFLEVKYLKGS